MTTENSQWQEEIRQKFDAAAAAEVIQTVEMLLADRSSAIMNHFASELVINLRDLRLLAQKIQQNCDAQTKATVLFELSHETHTDPVTLERFSQMLLDRIAENRQTLDLFTFYAMALAERENGQ